MDVASYLCEAALFATVPAPLFPSYTHKRPSASRSLLVRSHKQCMNVSFTIPDSVAEVSLLSDNGGIVDIAIVV